MLRDHWLLSCQLKCEEELARLRILVRYYSCQLARLLSFLHRDANWILLLVNFINFVLLGRFHHRWTDANSWSYWCRISLCTISGWSWTLLILFLSTSSNSARCHCCCRWPLKTSGSIWFRSCSAWFWTLIKTWGLSLTGSLFIIGSQAESLRLVGLGATWTRCSRLGSLCYTTNFTCGRRLLLLQFNKLFLEVVDLRLHLLNLLSDALVHLLGHGLLDEFRNRITHLLRDSSE